MDKDEAYGAGKQQLGAGSQIILDADSYIQGVIDPTIQFTEDGKKAMTNLCTAILSGKDTPQLLAQAGVAHELFNKIGALQSKDGKTAIQNVSFVGKEIRNQAAAQMMAATQDDDEDGSSKKKSSDSTMVVATAVPSPAVPASPSVLAPTFGQMQIGGGFGNNPPFSPLVPTSRAPYHHAPPPSPYHHPTGNTGTNFYYHLPPQPSYHQQQMSATATNENNSLAGNEPVTMIVQSKVPPAGAISSSAAASSAPSPLVVIPPAATISSSSSAAVPTRGGFTLVVPTSPIETYFAFFQWACPPALREQIGNDPNKLRDAAFDPRSGFSTIFTADFLFNKVTPLMNSHVERSLRPKALSSNGKAGVIGFRNKKLGNNELFRMNLFLFLCGADVEHTYTNEEGETAIAFSRETGPNGVPDIFYGV